MTCYKGMSDVKYVIFLFVFCRSNATNMLTRKRYRVKWCVPVVEVDVVDVGSGIMVNIDDKKTTIKYTHPGKFLLEQIFVLKYRIYICR